MADANAVIASAIRITTASGSQSSIDNVGAGTEAGEPDSGRTNSLWWYFRLTAASTVTITQPSPGFDAYLLLYKWTYNIPAPDAVSAAGFPLTLVAQNDDSGGGGGGTFTIAIAPGFYYIKYAAYSSGSSTAGVLTWSGLTGVSAADPVVPDLVVRLPVLAKMSPPSGGGSGPAPVPTTLQTWPRGNMG